MVYRPPFIKQMDGTAYAGRNCTMASACMAAVRHTRGQRPSGTYAPWYPRPWDLRRRTGDTSGGTTLAQADAVLYRAYRIDLVVKYNVSFTYFRDRIKSGSGAILQGGYAPIRATKYSGSKEFSGNHAVYVNEIRYNQALHRWEYLWYDPLADGRRPGLAKGPQWIPESLVRAFAFALKVTSTRRITYGLVYAAFTRDTEPVILRHGGTRYGPYSFRSTQATRIRRSPRGTGADLVQSIGRGTLFRAYQRAVGVSVNGNRYWYGDADGLRWVAAAHFKRA